MWDDPWFQDLPCKYKVLWQYILAKCDCAGVWKCNFRLASFQIGEPFESAEAARVFAGRIEDLGAGLWWAGKFCAFQYGELSEECRPHKPVIERLQKLGLLERVCKGYSKGIDTLQEKEKEKEKEKEGDSKGGAPDKLADEIYAEYPRKVGRPAALKVIERHIRRGEDPEVMLNAVRKFAAVWKGQSDLTYCPHPATWFNQERYKDDPATWRRTNGAAQNVDRSVGTMNAGCAHEYEIFDKMGAVFVSDKGPVKFGGKKKEAQP